MSKSQFAYRVEVDHERGTIAVYHSVGGSRSKQFVYSAYQINPQNLAQACRTAAFALLERADMYAHNYEFAPDSDIPEQVKIMMDENRDIFSTGS